MTLRFFATIVPIWIALSVIAGFSWGLAGWCVRRLRIWRAFREYRKFNADIARRRAS